MTGSPTLDKVLQSHQIGADDFMLKPFKNLKVIMDRVQFFLGNPRKESEITKENTSIQETQNNETTKAEIND
jgi:DNA-binding response OmpR family regulator